MEIIEQRILKDGVVIGDDILKVDSFLNQQIDVALLRAFAAEVKKEFGEDKIDRILTIEASGIAVAYAVSEAFGDLPIVFAKKSKTKVMTDDDFYQAESKSFTRGNISQILVRKPYIKKGEKVLLIDDFLAEGNAAMALISLCEQAEAEAVGLATFIEKRFQGGRDRLEAKGLKVFAGASIKAFAKGKPVF